MNNLQLIHIVVIIIIIKRHHQLQLIMFIIYYYVMSKFPTYIINISCDQQCLFIIITTNLRKHRNTVTNSLQIIMNSSPTVYLCDTTLEQNNN
jgi:ABC-type polysaccharide/polyol phosphate export permease